MNECAMVRVRHWERKISQDFSPPYSPLPTLLELRAQGGVVEGPESILRQLLSIGPLRSDLAILKSRFLQGGRAWPSSRE